MIWPLVVAVTALSLLEVTLRTFDRKLGRPRSQSRRFLRDFFVDCRRRLTLSRPASGETRDINESRHTLDQNDPVARSTYILIRRRWSGIPFAG